MCTDDSPDPEQVWVVGTEASFGPGWVDEGHPAARQPVRRALHRDRGSKIGRCAVVRSISDLFSSIGLAIGSIGLAIGSIDVAIGSIGLVIGRIEVAIGSIGLVIGRIEVAIGSIGLVIDPIDALIDPIGSPIGYLGFANASMTARCSLPLVAIIPRRFPISPFR
jgi:hypothetical protein